MIAKIRFSIILAFFTLLVSVAVSAAEKRITMRWAHYVPNRPNTYIIADEVFAKRVEELTNGKVKIRIYFGQTLGKVKELLTLVKSGTVDIASFPTGYFSSAFPLWTAPNNLPFVMETTEQAYRSAIELAETNADIQKEIKGQNLRLLFHHVLPPYQLFSKKPILKFEDLEGLKIRTWGAYMPQAYKAAGAVAVNVYPAEVYEALKRGVVDAAMWPLELGLLQRHHEVAPNICLWNVGSFVGWGNWMNLNSWNKLSDSQRDAVIKAAEEARKVEFETRVRNNQAAKEKLVSMGSKILEVPEAERKKWIEASPRFVEEWVASMKRKGLGKEAGNLKNRWQNILNR